MVAGPPRRGRHDAGKAKSGKVEFAHEGINDAHRVVRSHVVVEAVRQKGDLMTILALDEPRHASLPR